MTVATKPKRKKTVYWTKALIDTLVGCVYDDAQDAWIHKL